MFYKVKEDRRYLPRCLYNLPGINMEGRKQVLGCYVSESEGANFWLSVLIDLQNHGVNDILIAGINNLSGFEQAIQSVFPATEVQSCIVHQIRNRHKLPTYFKSPAAIRKLIYTTNTIEGYHR